MEVELLEKAKETMAKEPALLKLSGKIMVAGDTHGDVIIAKQIVKKFFDEKYDYLVFLGDYVDRAPPDISSSLLNINFLLEAKIAHPDKIYLLKGNHETNYVIPCYPHDFEYEAGQLYKKYVEIFMEMPLAAILNNVFAAHGGFPIKKSVYKIDKNDIETIEEITWSDVAISPVYRGAGNKFGKKELNEFLDKIKAKAFIRGHDYNMNGTVAYEKCLTIFSSRLYKEMGNGGVLIAKIDGNIESIKDIEIEDFSTEEWKRYEAKYID